MPTYTVKIKGQSHQFQSDLTDNEAIIRLRKLVKKGLVKGPFAENLLQRALDGELTPGWMAWVFFFASSKKARQEFGTDPREQQSEPQRKADYTSHGIYSDAALALQTIFGHSGAIQGIRDALRCCQPVYAGKWRGILFALEALPDPEAAQTPRKRLQLIED